MSDNLNLGTQRLLEPKRLFTGFDDLLHQCLRIRGSLSLQLLPDEVVLSAGPSQATGLALSGRWRSLALQGTPQGSGALLLLPFVFHIETLHLRHDQIYTLGRGDRTLADFFMRNLFYAACRRAPFTLDALQGSAVPSVAKVARDLGRTYGWISKALLRDPLLARSNFAELILASAHVPLPGLGSSLMQAGAASLRQCTAAQEARDASERQLATIAQLRARVLKLYA